MLTLRTVDFAPSTAAEVPWLRAVIPRARIPSLASAEAATVVQPPRSGVQREGLRSLMREGHLGEPNSVRHACIRRSPISVFWAPKRSSKAQLSSLFRRLAY